MGKIRRRPKGGIPELSEEERQAAELARMKGMCRAFAKEYNSTLAMQQAATRRRKQFPVIRTSATLAWAQNNPEKAKHPDSFHLPDLAGPADFVPPGQSGLYDKGPRTRLRKFHEYGVFVVHASTDKEERGLLFRAGFSEACPEHKTCNKKFCAKCWALAAVPPKGYRFIVREILTPDKAEVVDTTGVHAQGHKGKGRKVLLDHEAWDSWNGRKTEERRRREAEASKKERAPK